MLGLERRGIAWKLVAVAAVVAVVGGAVAPALATPAEWSGTVRLTGEPATDGTTYTYQIAESEAVENYGITLTGHTASEWDNQSWGSASNGANLGLSIGGNLNPGGPGGTPSVTFAGKQTTSSRSSSQTGTGTLSIGASTGGNQAPASEQIELTANPFSASNGNNYEWEYDGDSGSLQEREIQNPTADKIAEVSISHGGESDTAYYLAAGPKDGSQTGEHIATTTGGRFDVSDMSNSILTADTVHVEGVGDVTCSCRSATWGGSTIYGVSPTSASVSVDGGGSGGTFGMGTHGISLTQSTSTVTVTPDQGRISATVSWDDVTVTTNPSVSAPSGASASYSGTLSAGETVTKSLPVAYTDGSLDVSTGGGSSVGVDVSLKERAQTENVTVTINGNDARHYAALGDGETAELATNASWVQEGQNNVSVGVAPSLGSDAPTPSVEFDYSHQAASNQSVDYVGEVWSERWDTSQTWAGARESASLTIPFGEHVYSVRDLTVLSNGSEIGATSTTFNGTHLTVGVGDVTADETTRVVANGSKVQVANGSLTVTEPTALGQSLDTEFRIDSRSPGFHVDVGGTAKDRWLHYTTEESWTDAAEYAVVESSGAQSLYFPNAPVGGTASVSTLAVNVDPQTDVRLHVAQPGSLVFDVKPGSVAGDAVTYNYIGASAGTEYELVSLDRDGYRIAADSGSTAVLEADDSAETVQIRAVNSSTSSSNGLEDVGGGGGGGGIPAEVDPRANPYALLALSGTIILAGVGVAAYRPEIPMWVVVPVLVPVVLVVIATQSPGTLRQLVAGRFGTALEQVGPALLLVGGLVVAYVVYMAAQRWLGADKTVIDFSGLRGGQ